MTTITSWGSGSDQPTLDCQDCGKPLMILTPTQVRQVAEDPYLFIARCDACRAAWVREQGKVN